MNSVKDVHELTPCAMRGFLGGEKGQRSPVRSLVHNKKRFFATKDREIRNNTNKFCVAGFESYFHIQMVKLKWTWQNESQASYSRAFMSQV